MGWRSVLISQPARLALRQRSLLIEQDAGSAQVPLEDIAALVLDQPQVTLSAALLAALSQEQIALITVNGQHLPNGMLLPFTPHFRFLRVLRLQLAAGAPLQKRLWQQIIKQKIDNQACVLALHGQTQSAAHLQELATRVRSGDPDNLEAQAAQKYFLALFGRDFRRGDERFWNAGLNYAYAIVRAALARALCAAGLLPAHGLHHCNEFNAFNLADDMIEPWRPLLDAWVLRHYPEEQAASLTPQDKAQLISFLHQDVPLQTQSGRCTVLAALEQSVQSLVRALEGDSKARLSLPCIDAQGRQGALFDTECGA
ncbi:type II CRISPR-associated endonuclease Cas1 [Massilia sp. W12]|uniref:type II CRISPR-associated endonuclease Cas1 n=1 Tax=Massilia sp. W12 TaxID=3126507 RepID=UPI0030CCB391